MPKTDAEIYADAAKRRWPYVDEPRPGASVRRRREPPADLVEPTPQPRGPLPVLAGEAEE
jgi:hypothetical protein